MDAHDYLRIHYQIQSEMFFSGKMIRPDYTLYSSRLINDTRWNFAVINDYADLWASLHAVEKTFYRLNRRPCLYFPDSNPLPQIPSAYFPVRNEAWLEYASKELKSSDHPQVVKTLQHKSDFNRAYSEISRSFCQDNNSCGMYQNAYHCAVIQSFDSQKYYNFVLYEKKIPAAVGTLGICGDCGAIYNLGTIKKYRGRGLGREVVNACISFWRSLGGKHLFLQCDSDSNVENWFFCQGFRRLFVGYAYCRQES